LGTWAGGCLGPGRCGRDHRVQDAHLTRSTCLEVFLSREWRLSRKPFLCEGTKSRMGEQRFLQGSGDGRPKSDPGADVLSMAGTPTQISTTFRAASRKPRPGVAQRKEDGSGGRGAGTSRPRLDYLAPRWGPGDRTGPSRDLGFQGRSWPARSGWGKKGEVGARDLSLRRGGAVVRLFGSSGRALRRHLGTLPARLALSK